MKGLWDKYRNKGSGSRESSEDLRDETSHVISYYDLSTGMIEQTVSTWLNESGNTRDETSLVEASRIDAPVLAIDRVLTTGLNESLFSEQDIRVWGSGSDSFDADKPLSWRRVCRIDPWRTQQLERLAARVYGFRSVLVCQMSSLVLADLLTSRISPKMWADMYEMGVIPVVEHGHAPLLNGRVLCISNDPSEKRVRDYINSIGEFQTELVYADSPVVAGILELISQHIPAVGAVIDSRPILKKVQPLFGSTKRAA